MAVRPAEYGRRGLLGIGVPQANPTVEQEIGLLRPPGVSVVTARLVSVAPDTRTRLEDYLRELGGTLRDFDALALTAFGFACTGSSYLCGHAAERETIRRLEETAGYPIVTAADAIERALRHLGARRLAIVAPYPEWLGKLGVAYWESRGFVVAAHGRVKLPGTDTRQIYQLTSDDALDALRRLPTAGVDAVLFSGTGMPTLRAVARAAKELGLLAVSSNLCLAWALQQTVGSKPATNGAGQHTNLLSGWEPGLDSL
jgi:maleate isomerase